MTDAPKKAKEALQRAPTLYVIIVFKILKGLFFAGLALTVYNLSDNNLPDDYQKVLHVLGFNAERKFWTDLAAKVAQLTEPKMVHLAVGILDLQPVLAGGGRGHDVPRGLGGLAGDWRGGIFHSHRGASPD